MKNKKVRHVLGISGGKDSAALAIYLHEQYPDLDIEYYTCDTGKELEETYELIGKLEDYLQKKIVLLKGAIGSRDPFEHYYELYGGYLPSSNARWCTKKLKLEPFEEFVGDDLVISYVGIRGDEEREGYISRKSNIQSIFPFRQNLWSEDVISKALHNTQIPAIKELYTFNFPGKDLKRTIEIVEQPISAKFQVQQKMNLLLQQGVKEFNRVVFDFLKTTNYPMAHQQNFALLDNEDILVREDIFKLLETSGVGVPKYYKKVGFEVKGQTGEYARSRSGCYFCFFQQKIEWVWLYEQHPEKFSLAMSYENEKEGFTWNQNESLKQLIEPERIEAIKAEYLSRKDSSPKSPYLVDVLDDAEAEGCAACFI